MNGKLDNVSPGEPGVSENDLGVFLSQGNRGVMSNDETINPSNYLSIDLFKF